ncbi:hypothetical protein DFO80_13337 [Rhodobacter sp. 140A]|jgi:hypothetical protein|uniref:Nitric oxide reductase F protein n=1 Tax=Paenirhodobacter hankyongi TaxID=2294033 RepID=A0A421BJA6_9RHOB|nr:hypothetical protein [Sinirhodobacter hankyongi]RBP83349.1 hypothetical protein DFO80_13337 [Rhodobacter sp. 140A]RLL61990.1 hypothetical protein DYS74_17520 [Sinirhodobacter hankyongi]
MDPLTRNWLWLLALIGATVALAGWPAALLAVAFLKAVAILNGFLHLTRASGWLTAFAVPLGLWLAAIWALHAVG